MTLCTAPIAEVVQNCCLQLQGDFKQTFPGAATYCDTNRAGQWSTCVNANGIANSSYVLATNQAQCLTGAAGTKIGRANMLLVLFFILAGVCCGL